MVYHNHIKNICMYCIEHNAKPHGMAVPWGFFRLAVFRISV